MRFLSLPDDEHPQILAAEYQAIRATLTDTEAMLMACLANILNELPEYLDGKYAPGSSLDHAHGALMTMLKGGLLPISNEYRAKAAALRGDCSRSS